MPDDNPLSNPPKLRKSVVDYGFFWCRCSPEFMAFLEARARAADSKVRHVLIAAAALHFGWPVHLAIDVDKRRERVFRRGSLRTTLTPEQIQKREESLEFRWLWLEEKKLARKEKKWLNAEVKGLKKLVRHLQAEEDARLGRISRKAKKALLDLEAEADRLTTVIEDSVGER